MNENYLWDKSGSDPEIEKLEHLLRGYRYEEGEPPALPATNVVVIDRPQRRWDFRMIFAASAGLALVLLAGVWLRSGENAFEHAKVTVSEPSADKSSAAVVEPIAPTSKQPEPAPMRNALIPAGTSSKNVRSRPYVLRARPVRSKKVPPPELTAEEKHAFGQLMLALSITGSKLRIVREMIDGTESLPTDDK